LAVPARPCCPLPAGLPPLLRRLVAALGFGSFLGGVLCLVLFLFWVRPVVPVLLPGLCPVVGFGLGGLCLAALVGLRLRLACSCRLALIHSRLPSRVVFRLWAGGFGCVPVLLVRPCSRLAVCRFRLGRSKWRCLLACPLALRAWFCLLCRLFLRWRRWVFNLPGIVAVAGSRVLPASGSALVAQVASGIVGGGGSLVVGCCSGADAAVLSSVPGFIPPSLVRCLCAFGSGGVGSGSASAVAAVSSFAGAGGSVQWWAGGPASVALRVRLAARTRAVVAAAGAGLVVFFASPSSRGSLLACRYAVSCGLPVVAFPVWFPVSKLPSLGAGSWVPLAGYGGFKWVANQVNLFQ
jgi:hypothetical protein